MPTPPSKLQVGTKLDDAYSLVNNNFDNIAQDLRDFGASTSTASTVTFTISTSAKSSQVVVLVSSEDTINASPFKMRTQKSTSGIAIASPFVRVWVDAVDDAHSFYGGSLTAAQANFQLSITTANASYSNSLAAFVIDILNRDVSTHTYTVEMRCWYIPIAATSVFR